MMSARGTVRSRGVPSSIIARMPKLGEADRARAMATEFTDRVWSLDDLIASIDRAEGGPMPRPRFTVRRLMLAVAIVAVMLSVAVPYMNWRRRVQMKDRAYWHKDQAYKLWCYYLEPIQTKYGGAGLGYPSGDSPDFGGSARWKSIVSGMPPAERAFAQHLTLRHAYHKAMQAKWEHAAGSSWSRVPPDPVMPPSIYDPLPNVWSPPSPWTRGDY